MLTGRDLERAYFNLHAFQADAFAWARLTSLMRRVNKHRKSCNGRCLHGTCPISVRRALKIEADIESIVIDILLEHDRLMGKPGEARKLAGFARDSTIRTGIYPAP